MNVIILEYGQLQAFARTPYWTQLVKLCSLFAVYDKVTMQYTVLKDRSSTCARDEQVPYSKLSMALADLAFSSCYRRA